MKMIKRYAGILMMLTWFFVKFGGTSSIVNK